MITVEVEATEDLYLPGRESMRLQTRLDVHGELCRPEDDETDPMVSRCECGRLAFAYVGDPRGPWVDCVCGARFNANHRWIGNQT